MVHGPQGGWYIQQRTCHQHLERGQNPSTAVDVESQTTVVDVTNQVALARKRGTGTYTGMYGFLDGVIGCGRTDTPPELLCYHEFELTMTMIDTGGRELVETKAGRTRSRLDL